MKEITRKVVSYCEIPEDLTEDSWLQDMSSDCYVDYTLSDEDMDKWILENYSELREGDKIFINIDY